MTDANDSSRKAILVLLIIIIAGASFYLGFYLAKGESKQSTECSLSSNSTPSFSSLQLITSPEGEAEDNIISLLQSANRSIEVEMYTFTNSKLANALISAKKRGINVQVLIGETGSEDEGTIITLLNAGGIEVKKAPSKFKIMHAKLMIVDDAIVLIGSHNWSQNAMFYNRELSVVIQSPSLATQLLEIFNSDWAKSSKLP